MSDRPGNPSSNDAAYLRIVARRLTNVAVDKHFSDAASLQLL